MTNRTARNNFIKHLHAFRGFAILTIVGAHSWSLLLFTDDFNSIPSMNNVFALTETLFHGSTIYFAVISGLLFSLVLKRKGWKAFFRSKILNVVTPYALISLFFLTAFWPMYVEWFASEGKSTVFLRAYLDGLLKGTVMLPFWYIPVLIVLYAATPVLDAFLRHSRLAWIAGIIILLPLGVSRTTYPDLLSVQTLVYFLGAYALGMLCGMHYERAKALVQKFLLSFWVAAVACSLVVLLFFLNEYEPTGHYSIVQTLVYVQKLSITALTLHYFSRYEDSLPRVMFVLGSYAFAIYFFHFFMANVAVQVVLIASEGHTNAYSAAAGGLFVLLAAVALSVLFSWFLKLLFKSRSRMIIGA